MSDSQKMVDIYKRLSKTCKWMNSGWAEELFSKDPLKKFSDDFTNCETKKRRIFFKNALKYFLRNVIENGEVDEEKIPIHVWKLANESLNKWRESKKRYIEEEKRKIDHDNALRCKNGRILKEEEVCESKEMIEKLLASIDNYDYSTLELPEYPKVCPTRSGFLFIHTPEVYSKEAKVHRMDRSFRTSPILKIPISKHAIYSGPFFEPGLGVRKRCHILGDEDEPYWRRVGYLKKVE